MAESGEALSHHQGSWHGGHVSALSTGHGHLKRIHYRLITAFSVAQTTAYPLLNPCCSYLQHNPLCAHYWAVSCIWKNNSRMQIQKYVWWLGTALTEGVWESGWLGGAPVFSRMTRKRVSNDCCLSCLALCSAPVLSKLKAVSFIMEKMRKALKAVTTCPTSLFSQLLLTILEIQIFVQLITI